MVFFIDYVRLIFFLFLVYLFWDFVGGFFLIWGIFGEDIGVGFGVFWKILFFNLLVVLKEFGSLYEGF